MGGKNGPEWLESAIFDSSETFILSGFFVLCVFAADLLLFVAALCWGVLQSGDGGEELCSSGDKRVICIPRAVYQAVRDDFFLVFPAIWPCGFLGVLGLKLGFKWGFLRKKLALIIS